MRERYTVELGERPMFGANALSIPAENRAAAWLIPYILMLPMLIWPALWNGFPIVFHDTGGYLMRPFEATLEMGRSAIYGAFLQAGIAWQFWPNILLQAIVVAWIVLLTLRLYGLGGRPELAVAVLGGLCAFTGMPWYAAQLMPDIMVSIAVLGVTLLAFHGDETTWWEKAILVALIAAAIASHMSILALALGIIAVLAFLRTLAGRLRLPRPALALPAMALATGILLALLSNFAIARQFAFTPGGFNFVFSRLVQDGIAQRYLAEHCPDPGIRLCSFAKDLPNTADDWLWHLESPIHKLGGFEEFEPEARRIVLDSLSLYPLMHIRTAALSTLKQFVAIATGDGLTPWSWYTRLTFEQMAPAALQGYLAGKQATVLFDFTWINLVHLPVQALTIAALPFVVVARPGQRIAGSAALLFVALLGNAAICGVLSNPHDRYQSRLAWLAVLVLTIAVLGPRRSHEPSTA